MILSLLQVLAICGCTARGFEVLKPQFIPIEEFSYVSNFIQQPQNQIIRKQATLALRESEEIPSLTNSIQIETMTAGMSFLQTIDESAFFVDLTINSKNYPVLLDTGSPYLWLYSNDCKSPSCINKINDLLPSDTIGLTLLNNTFDLSYTQKTIASGEIVIIDSMIIANFKTHNFEFGLANETPDIFENYPFVGVLGLPADNSSVTGLSNIVSFLFDNGDINHSKFTICMGEFQSDIKNSGLLFLGDTKSNLKNGEMFTSNLIKSANSHWEFIIDNVFINDYKLSFDSMNINNLKSNNSRIGLLDSGTTSLVLPKNDALVIHSFFPNSITDGENYAIFCNSTNDIILEISGKNWTIPSTDYLGPKYNENSNLSGYCISNIQGLDSTNDNSWILGILFMMNKYVEFDYENQWIGIAERNNNIKFVDPPSDNNNSSSLLSSSEIITITNTQTTLEISSTNLISNYVSTSSLKSHNGSQIHFIFSNWIHIFSLILSLFAL